jgi:quercetin dioxygenase-like cupin family protein
MTDARSGSGAQATERIEKPWGYELLWAAAERYAGKTLYINAGARLSLHLHRFKDETLHVHSGKLSLLVREGTRLREHLLGPGQSYRIAPHTLHRLQAVTDCEVMEVSTPYLDDVVRLEDDYGRARPRELAPMVGRTEASSDLH